MEQTQGSDYSTIRWAHAMARGTIVIVRTNSGVVAGKVNEISHHHVRIGEKRVLRCIIQHVTRTPNGT